MHVTSYFLVFFLTSYSLMSMNHVLMFVKFITYLVQNTDSDYASFSTRVVCVYVNIKLFIRANTCLIESLKGKPPRYLSNNYCSCECSVVTAYCCY